MPTLRYCSTGPRKGSTDATGSCPGICNHHRNLKTWAWLFYFIMITNRSYRKSLDKSYPSPGPYLCTGDNGPCQLGTGLLQ